MTTATAAILASLNEVFAPVDAEVLEATKVWAAGRTEALKEFKASAEVAERRKQKEFSYWYYPKCFAICGGKTWYHVFNDNNEAGRNAFVVKNHEATIAKRNAMITRNLEKAGVTSIVTSEYARTRDGFNGTFVVETNAGRKFVTVNTIRAGGYNIQCLHLRVLVKVK